MRIHLMVVAAMLIAAPLAAQDDLASRVRGRVPAGAAERVLALMDAARQQSLPAEAVADVALYGAARGADPEAIVAAAREEVRLLDLSRGALGDGGISLTGEEIAAGAQALRAGVAPDELRRRARETADGQPLATATTLLAGLAAAGLPTGRAAEVLAGLGVPAGPPGGLPIGGFTLPFGPPPGLPVNIGAPGDRPGRPAGPPVNPPGGRP